MTQSQYNSFIGIDVSKDTVTVHDSASGKTFDVTNTARSLGKWVKGLATDILCLCEPTGGHERRLLAALVAYDIPVHRVDARKVKSFIRSLGIHGKSDAIDAKALARYGSERHESLPLWKKQDSTISQLKALTSRRRALCDMLVEEQNRAQALILPEAENEQEKKAAKLLRQSSKRIIKTLEKRAIEPHASDATNSNIKLIGTTASNDSPRGYICSNQLGPYGRPIAFIFAGACPYDDSSEIFLKPEDLNSSINVEQLRTGNAYPLFYDTLFHDIREYLTDTTVEARSAGRGVWSFDKSTTGFDWDDPSQMPPIFPKLWRRIDTYSRDDTYFELEKPFKNFRQYLNNLGEERVLIKSENRFTGFDDLIETTDSTAKLLANPEDIVVVS